jgi:hypothetical protein
MSYLLSRLFRRSKRWKLWTHPFHLTEGGCLAGPYILVSELMQELNDCRVGRGCKNTRQFLGRKYSDRINIGWET